MNYSASLIVRHNWPALTKEANGKYRRIWVIDFEESIQETYDLQDIERQLSYQGFRVSLSRVSSTRIEASVTTDDWGWEHHLYESTYRFLEEVNYALGSIELIQDQPKHDWEPWLSRKLDRSAYCTVSRWIMKKVQVGLRIDKNGLISFFGIDEINEILSSGLRVIKVEPKGALMTEVEPDLSQEETSFVLNGYSVIFFVEENSPFPK